MRGVYMIELVCLHELEFQCQISLAGMKSLRICVEARKKHETAGPINFASSPEQVRSAYSVLGHAAIVGRFLFNKKKKTRIQERCAQLRKLLDINESDTPMLSNFAIRNRWEHIDERIDKYGAEWTGDMITYEPPRVELLSVSEREHVVFLGVDPDQLAVYHLKNFQPLEPIEKEVTLVHDAIRSKGFRKLEEGTVVPLYDQWK